jgi:hypothetical protein
MLILSYTQKEKLDVRKKVYICVNLDFTLLRILSTKNLCYNFKYSTFNQNTPLDKTLNYFGLSLNFSKKEDIKSYNLIVHVHGGGFFSQSTESHLGYLVK